MNHLRLIIYISFLFHIPLFVLAKESEPIKINVENCSSAIQLGNTTVPCYLLKQIQEQLNGEIECLQQYKLDYVKAEKQVCFFTDGLIYDKNQANLIDYTGEFDQPKKIEFLNNKICVRGVKDQTEGQFILNAGFRNRYQLTACRPSSLTYKAQVFTYHNENLTEENADDQELMIFETKTHRNPTNTSICMSFNYLLKQKQDIQNLMTISEINKQGIKSPAKDPIFQVERDQLCILGLKPKQKYGIEIKEGLLGFSSYYRPKEKRSIMIDIPLKKQFNIEIETKELKQRILLSNQKYIMPGNGNLFIRYFNSKKVEVSVYAVDERNFSYFLQNRNLNMLQLKINEYYSRPFDVLSNMLTSEIGSKVWSGVYDLPEQQVGKEGTALLPIQGLKDRKNALYLVLVNVKKENPVEGESYSWSEENEIFEDTHRIQWLVVSRIGLYATIIDDQLEVKALDLENNEAISDLKIDLIAKNNRILMTQESNSDGKAFFPKALLDGKNADAASLIVAQNEQKEIALLDIKSNTILLDRNLNLMNWMGNQAFVSTEREAYRPDEKVKLFVNLRNAMGQAQKLDILVKITKANGDIFKIIEGKTDEFGSFYQELKLDQNAITGDWHIEVFDLLKLKEKLKNYYADQNLNKTQISDQDFMIDEYLKQSKLFVEATLGKTLFKVDSFIIPNLQADAQISWHDEKPMDGMLRRADIKVKASYMHGGSAKGVTVQADVYFRKMPSPSKALVDYQFGDQSEKTLLNLNILAAQELNEQGETVITIPSLPKPDSLSPRVLECRLIFNDSNGSSVEKYIQLPVQINDLEIGIKGIFDKNQVIQGDEAEFEVIVTDFLGKPQSNQEILITWKHLIEEQNYTDFWDESSRFEAHLLDQVKKTTDQDGKIKLKSAPLLKGFYVLHAKHLKNQSTSTYRFMVADRWFYSEYDFENSSIDKHNQYYQYPKYSIESNDKSDIPLPLKYELKTTNAQNDMQIGDRLRFESNLPADGYLRLMVLNHKKIWEYEENVSSGQKVIEIPITQEWKNGVHFWAFFVRNGSNQYQHLPRRWTSVQWLISKAENKAIELSLGKMPAVIRPSQNLEIDYELKNLDAPKAQVLFWLVDEAVLNLTHYQMKEIFAILFKPKKLSLLLLDAYQHILENFEATLAKISSGGDAGLDSNQNGLKEGQEILALSSGLMQVEGNQSKVRFALPEFNGKARLMAYVVSAGQVGQFNQLLDIRQEVIIDVAAPRFLAEGDQTKVKLKIFYQDGDEGLVNLKIAENSKLHLKGKSLERKMKAGELWEEEIAIQMKGEKHQDLDISLLVPNKTEPIHKKQKIQTRPAWPLKTLQYSTLISAGQETQVNLFTDSRYNQLRLTVSPNVPFDIIGMIKDLNDYPYGCAEQLTSKAFPQIAFENLVNHWQLDVKKEFKKTVTEFKEINQAHINKALDELVQLQKEDGKFGYWRGSYGDLNLTLYVMHFLLETKRKAVTEVNAQMLLHGINAIQQIANMSPTNLSIGQIKQKLYALYLQSIYQLATKTDILAQVSNLNTSINGYLNTPFTDYYLSQIIDFSEADLLKRVILDQFNMSVSEPNVLQTQLLTQKAGFMPYAKYYISDLSRLLYLSAQAKLDPKVQDELMFYISELMSSQHYLSTLDQGWLLLALDQQGKRIKKQNFSAMIQGESAQSEQAIHRFFKNVKNKTGIAVKNQGDQPLYLYAKGVSTSEKAPAPYQSAFEVNKTFMDMQGNVISEGDLAKGVESGKQILVKLTVTQKDNQSEYPNLGQILVVDLLAGGTTIEPVFSAKTKDLIQGVSQNLRLCKIEEKQNLPDRMILAFDPRFVMIAEGEDGGGSQEEGGEGGEGESTPTNVCHFVYLIKTTLPGHYIMPGVFAESMSHPSISAQGATSVIRVLSY